MTMSQVVTNEHRTFYELDFVPFNSFHAIKTYCCMYCGKVLMSKTGAINHKCFIPFPFIPNVPIFPHQMIMDFYLRAIATTNASYLSAENENLRLCMYCLNPQFLLPKKDKLRRLMIDLAERIRCQTLANLRNRVVSLMIDGCQRWGKKYERVIIYTSERLYLYSVLKIRDGKARTLEEILAGVLETLKNNKTTVVSINSDNASVNVAALNGDLQNITNSHFIRQPCAAHTLNLAIEDTFLHNPRANRIYKSIELLVTHPPKNSIRNGYSNKLATIRWISIFDCLNFIHHHKQKYRNARVQEVADALQLIEDEIGLENMHEIMIIVQPFLSAIERDQASIADIIPAFLKAHASLSGMQDWLAKLLFANLVHRFTTTCSFINHTLYTGISMKSYHVVSEGIQKF